MMLSHQEETLSCPVSAPFLARYHSVEFVLNSPHPIYQFKLWRTSGNGVFLLVKDNSKLLNQLKVGSILPMKYMSGNAIADAEVRDTQIKRIVNERQGRFQGHHRVELAVMVAEENEETTPQAVH